MPSNGPTRPTQRALAKYRHRGRAPREITHLQASVMARATDPFPGSTTDGTSGSALTGLWAAEQADIDGVGVAPGLLPAVWQRRHIGERPGRQGDPRGVRTYYK
jgi:hypothetical protein